MEIYLVRHTTPKIEKGICYGQTDLDVEHTFLEELKIIQQQIPKNIAAVYSSPLTRCKKLALHLSGSVIFDDRLMELNFGDWELQKWKHIETEALNPWMENFVHTKTPNGESYMDLHKRSISFLESLKDQKKTQALVITHAGVIRSIWSHLQNIPLEKSFDLKLKYGEVLRLKVCKVESL